MEQIISLENRTEKEVNRRITLAWNKYWSLKHIFKGTFRNDLKSSIFNNCVIPTLTYGSQTWALSAKSENKIKITQNKMERSILKLKLRDKIPTKVIKSKLKHNSDITRECRRIKWKWTGHVARTRDDW